MYLLFTCFRSWDDTPLHNCVFQISSLFLCICAHNLQKIKLQISLRPEMGNKTCELKKSITKEEWPEQTFIFTNLVSFIYHEKGPEVVSYL